MKQEFDPMKDQVQTEETQAVVQQANWNPDRYRTNLNPFYLSPCSVERRDDVHQDASKILEVETSSPLQQLFEHNQTTHTSEPAGKKFKTGIVVGVGAIIGGSVSVIRSVQRSRRQRTK
ncbi:hypothetical protein ACRPK8_06300 [Exiguobacterium sp. TDN 0502]|uniref:hypothetical protein n=1 Tax=Exiguobacterium sp. TDN 0502 TaxID=3420731 RepID=UPI003D77518A